VKISAILELAKVISDRGEMWNKLGRKKSRRKKKDASKKD
jgi:hypothetical protein